MTWAGIAQDTPAPTCECDHDHTKRDIYVNNAEDSSSSNWCSSYSGHKHNKTARIEGDQEFETVGILRSRSGSEESEQSEHYHTAQEYAFLVQEQRSDPPPTLGLSG